MLTKVFRFDIETLTIVIRSGHLKEATPQLLQMHHAYSRYQEFLEMQFNVLRSSSACDFHSRHGDIEKKM